MKCNSKMSYRRSVVINSVVRFGVVIVMMLVMVLVNILASSRCSQQLKAIGEKERTLRRLEDERQQESTRWEEMTTPDKLEIALLRHGLAMKTPRPDQCVRMRADGRPFPGQLSVARAGRAVAPSAAQYRRRKR